MTDTTVQCYNSELNKYKYLERRIVTADFSKRTGFVICPEVKEDPIPPSKEFSATRTEDLTPNVSCETIEKRVTKKKK